MKKIVIAAAAVCLLPLAACTPKTDAGANAMSSAENSAMALDNQADMMRDDAANGAAAMEAKADNKADAMENKADAMRETGQNKADMMDKKAGK